MILTPEQAEERLSSPNNLSRLVQHERCGLVGRSSPPVINREAIATLDILGVRQKVIAQAFGTTQASVSNIANEAEMQQVREDTVAPIKDLAIRKLMTSLELLDESKIANSKARDIASIATSMAKVTEFLSPKAADNAKQVNVLIYAPGQKTLADYKTIEA